MSGYVRIHRSLLGHVSFRNDAEAMAFAWMIARAQWKACKVRYKDRVIALNRGQLAVSVRDMATAMDRDKAWVERLWKRLKAETMIETVTEAGVSVVTICNYGAFQGERDTDETMRETPSETGARQARDTEQEDNNLPTEGNNTAREKPKTDQGTRLAADFVMPDEWIVWAMSERGWSRKDAESEAANFVDFWHAKPGKDGRKTDWLATWRNWVRNSRRTSGVTPFPRSGAPPPGKTLAEQILERQAVRA